MRSILRFLGTLAVLFAVLLVVHVTLGAEVGEGCSDFVLSCRATRGVLTVNACLHEGASAGESYCSYACREASECPEGWSCDPAWGYASVPSAVEDVERVCRRPAR
ncbi:MAG: hypothetical protein U0234_16940 [Sandaracinus sp.]